MAVPISACVATWFIVNNSKEKVFRFSQIESSILTHSLAVSRAEQIPISVSLTQRDDLSSTTHLDRDTITNAVLHNISWDKFRGILRYLSLKIRDPTFICSKTSKTLTLNFDTQ